MTNEILKKFTGEKEMKKHIIKLSLLLFTVLFLQTGCDLISSDTLNENPPHIVTTDDIYKDLAGFEAGLNGLYAVVRQEMELGGFNRLPAEIAYGNGTDVLSANSALRDDSFSRIAENYGDVVNPRDPWLTRYFEWLYRIINSSNSIINQAAEREINWEGDHNRNRIVGEARAIRAWAYRHLTNNFGDVPLNLDEASGETIRTDWTRTPVNEVRQQIIDDLLFAEAHIPVEQSMQGRLTRGAVQHYLSEMYLVLKDYQSALQWADRAINTPEYQLITERYGVRLDQEGIPFMDMHIQGNRNRNAGNTEALWVFQFAYDEVGGGSHGYRNVHMSRYASIVEGGVNPIRVTPIRGGTGSTRASLTNFMINLYEPNDDRGSNLAIRKYFILKDADQNAPFGADRLPDGYAYGDTLWMDWGHEVGVNEITPNNRINVRRPFSRKVEGVNPNDLMAWASANNVIRLRLADTYMLKAEAQYRLGDLNGAAETINIIRQRSNASSISANQVDIDFILDERARELVWEEDRRYHLIRMGKLVERTRKYNFNGGQFITDRDTIFPIPQNVIDSNLTGEMPQNPGY